MTRDLNPGISVLDEPALKKQLADQAERALELTDALKLAPPLSEERLEAERFAAESNEYAAQNPFYAAARSAAVNFSVVPLEPGGTEPIDPTKASNDPRTLFEWWAETPDANVGVRLGRVAGILGLRIEDLNACRRGTALVPSR